MTRRDLEIEREIIRIQRGTRTLFRIFNPTHVWLMSHSKLYYLWSTRPISRISHWAFLLLYIVIIPVAILGLDGKSDNINAAGNTFTEDFSTTTYRDSGNTTAKWDTANTKALLSYSMEPVQTSGLNNLSKSLNSPGSAYVTDSPSTNNHMVYIFGGGGSGAGNNQIFKYDPGSSNGRVSLITATAGGEESTAIYYPPTDKIYVFTTVSSGHIEADYQTWIWEFDVASETMTKLSESFDLGAMQFTYDSDDEIIIATGGFYRNKPMWCQSDYCINNGIYTFKPDRESKIQTAYLFYPEHYGPNVAIGRAGGQAIYHKEGNDKYLYLIGGWKDNWEEVIAKANRDKDLAKNNMVSRANAGGDEILYNATSHSRSNEIFRIKLNNEIIAKAVPKNQIAKSGLITHAYAGETGYGEYPNLPENLEFGLAFLPNELINFAMTEKGDNYYIYGGQSDEGGTLAKLLYNPNQPNDVTTLNNNLFSTPQSSNSAVYDSQNDSVYLFGSASTAVLIDTDIDNGGNVTTLEDQLFYFTGHSSSAAYTQSGNFGYVFGGGTTSIDKFNFITEEVTNVGSSAYLSSNMKAVTANDGNIYLFGGSGGLGVYKFDVLSEALSKIGDLLYASGTATAYDTATDSVYIVGLNSPRTTPDTMIVQSYPIGQATPLLESQIFVSTLPYVSFNYGLSIIDSSLFVSLQFSSGTYSINLTDPNHTMTQVTTMRPTNYRFINYNNKLYFIDYLYKLRVLSPDNPTSIGTIDIPMFTDTGIATFVKDGYFYTFTSSGALQKFSPYYSNSSVIQSKKINTGSTPIYKASLSADVSIPDGTSIQLQLSSDGGTSWHNVDNNGSFEFAKNSLVDRAYASSGTDLRWRATLIGTDELSPTINSVNISYYGAANSLYFSLPSNPTKNAGQPSDEFKVGLKDLSGQTTLASNNHTIALSSDSANTRFSTSSAGPWTSILDVNIAKGQEFGSFYYLNYEPGTHIIYATAPGLASSSTTVTTGPGTFSGSTFSYTPNPVSVSDPNDPVLANRINSNIRVALAGASIANKTVTITSSDGRDVINQPQNQTGVDGTTNGTILSKYAGDKTTTIHIMPDSVFVEASNKLTFVPAAVSSVGLSAGGRQTIKAGEGFTLTASLHDRFGNKATNSIDAISITSTDNIFSNLSHKFTSQDGGDVDIPNVVLRTAGKQTITARDNDTGVNGSIEFIVLADSPLASSSKITSDKSRLVLNHDKATVTVKIADQYGNGIEKVSVHIRNEFTYGSLDKIDGITDSSGNSTFVYTPSSEGKEDFHAFTDTFVIPGTLSVEIMIDTLLNQLGSLVDVLQKNETATTIANIAKNVVAATATLGIITLIANALGSAPAALHAVNYALSIFLEALGIRKRRKSWGRVYDSTNGKGVDYALVRLYDQQTMKLKGTIVTDIRGKYYFQPTPGNYVISVSKKGYIYPTEIFARFGIAKVNKNASRNSAHYVGQTINITDKDNYLNIEIPIDPIDKKATFWIKIKIITTKFIDFITFGFSYIFMPLLALGLIASIFSVIVITDARNIILSVIYFIIALIYIISRIIKSRRTGLVYDIGTKRPIQGAVVSIFDKEHHTLKETRITDRYGRYSIFAESGQYELQVIARNYKNAEHTRVQNLLSKYKKKRLFDNELIELKKSDFIIRDVAMEKG